MVSVRRDRKGGIHFVEVGKGVIMVLSHNQLKILTLGDRTHPCMFATEELYKTLFGLPDTKTKRARSGKTATPAQRASLSRSLRKLEQLGFIERFACHAYVTTYRLTDAGKELADDLKDLFPGLFQES